LLDKKEYEQAICFGIFDYCFKVAGTSAKLATLILLEENEKKEKK